MRQILMILLLVLILSSFVYSRDDASCDTGNCVNGKGTATFLTGEVYTGQWKNGLRHGKGILIIPSDYGNYNDKYEGYWKDDKQHGKGFLRITPEEFNGTWVNGELNGKGSYLHFDGTKYVGTFKNGKFDGKGILLTPLDDAIPSRRFLKYEGEFKEGLYHGMGVLTKPSKDGILKYVGKFENDKILFEGKCFKNDKEVDCNVIDLKSKF